MLQHLITGQTKHAILYTTNSKWLIQHNWFFWRQLSFVCHVVKLNYWNVTKRIFWYQTGKELVTKSKLTDVLLNEWHKVVLKQRQCLRSWHLSLNFCLHDAIRHMHFCCMLILKNNILLTKSGLRYDSYTHCFEMTNPLRSDGWEMWNIFHTISWSQKKVNFKVIRSLSRNR